MLNPFHRANIEINLTGEPCYREYLPPLEPRKSLSGVQPRILSVPHSVYLSLMLQKMLQKGTLIVFQLPSTYTLCKMTEMPSIIFHSLYVPWHPCILRSLQSWQYRPLGQPSQHTIFGNVLDLSPRSSRFWYSAGTKCCKERHTVRPPNNSLPLSSFREIVPTTLSPILISPSSASQSASALNSHYQMCW
jgi:hypothetical protein